MFTTALEPDELIAAVASTRARSLFSLGIFKADFVDMQLTGRVRLDKWLWAARFFKTRSLAADAVDRGRVSLDRRQP